MNLRVLKSLSNSGSSSDSQSDRRGSVPRRDTFGTLCAGTQARFSLSLFRGSIPLRFTQYMGSWWNLVYTLVLGTSASRRESSSLSGPTQYGEFASLQSVHVHPWSQGLRAKLALGSELLVYQGVCKILASAWKVRSLLGPRIARRAQSSFTRKTCRVRASSDLRKYGRVVMQQFAKL